VDIYRPDTNVYALRRKVGLVFQKPCVFQKNIFNNAIFRLKEEMFGKGPPDLVAKIFREVFFWQEVQDRLGEKATTLSQGQQQRLTLPRTLAIAPRYC
jgi:phosphate transport system ATP-binding protein